MRARRSAWGLLVLVAAAGFASCSYAPKYAATINDDGHVQIEWCFTSPDLVVESSSSHDVSELDRPFEPGDDNDFVDLEVPSPEWTMTGEIELQPDTVLTVWEENDFDRASRSTTTSAAAASSVYVYLPEPVLQVSSSCSWCA